MSGDLGGGGEGEGVSKCLGDPAAAADKSLMLEMMMRERIAHDEMAPRAVMSA